MLLKTKYILAIFGAVVFLGFLSSCQKDVLDDFQPGETDKIIFHAYSSLEDGVTTRANNSITDITNTYYNGINFHFYMTGKNKNDIPGKKMKDYVVPSGYSGILQEREESEKINWLSRASDHNIWSWTTPWINDVWVDLEEEEREPEPFYKLEFKDTSITETLSSGASTWEENSWRNGKDLDKFISAAVGPVSYNVNGQFIPITYRHLVSKILLGAFSVIDNSTAVSKTNLKGNITFYGMPRELNFYPAPMDEDEEGNSVPVRGYIEMPEDYAYSEDEGVTYAITNYDRALYNDAGTRLNNPFYTSSSIYTYFKDEWWIPPEVDLREISFKIEIYEWVTGTGWVLSKDFGENGGFYGDFSNLNLSRTPDSNYDNAEDDFYKLHASEYLILSMNLSTKGNPSVSGIVARWNETTMDRSGAKHPKDGIFSLEGIKDFSSVMSNGDQETIEEYFEVYGSGEYTENGEGIFKLYEDVGTPNTPQFNWSTQKNYNLYVADGYILDGLDHVVECASTSMTIGKVRNIYFRYWVSGTNTSTGITSHSISMIYVDEDGNVWLVDGFTLEKTPTPYNINDVGDKNPFTINLSTGRVS